MLKDFNGNEQALVAVLSELQELDVNIAELEQRVISGIMGNKEYTWVNAEYKPEVLSTLKKAIRDLK